RQVADAVQRFAGDDPHVGLVAEQGKVDAKFVFVGKLDAENHRLDRDLPGLDVDLAEDLVDLGNHGCVIADDDNIGVGKRVATCFDLVGGNVDLGGARNGGSANFGRQHRDDE